MQEVLFEKSINVRMNDREKESKYSRRKRP